MPQQPNHGGPKKKKGRAPAHQNKFAFRHNPKSKKTEKILAHKVEHVCQRCKEKLEWRKKYRKYKPRTQPGTCNICKQRNVKAAYHTICTSCTTSAAAWKLQGKDDADHVAVEDSATASVDDAENAPAPKSSSQSLLEQVLAQQNGVVDRMCAMCVKEVALRDDNDNNGTNVSELINRLGPMSLREKRSLERQIAKQIAEEEGDEAGENDGEEEQDDEDHGEFPDGGLAVEQEDDDSVTPEQDSQDEEDDPFLKAVGGADKLLTGEAYQKMLLAKAQGSSS